MLLCCPFCGNKLSNPIKDGIASCSNCQRLFDTSPYNRILSVCWYIRKHHIVDLELLKHHGIQEVDALIGLALAYDGDYNHQETEIVLTKLGVSKEILD